MTRKVKVKNIIIGGGSPISIQSMTTTPTCDVESTVNQIVELENAGCDIVRVAVRDENDALAIRKIVDKITLPLVADIHFDFRLAIAAMENGADKIRINPGNIGSDEKIKMVVDAAKMHNVPIRVGVNGGSLDKEIEAKYGRNGESLAMSAMKSVSLLEKFKFDNIVISCKSSSVVTCCEAYRIISRQTDYPLHVGITEAGTFNRSIVRSSIGIGSLLMDGIGDTIRVSITGSPIQEVKAAYDILSALEMRSNGVEIVSCPTCGRCRINVEKIVGEVERRTSHIKKPLKIAIMGCVVNGIGEGRDADIGLAGGDGSGVIFSSGKVLKTVKEENMVDELVSQIEAFEKI